MTRFRLPEGVPADNQDRPGRDDFHERKAGFADGVSTRSALKKPAEPITPDTATPQFDNRRKAGAPHAAAKTVVEKREVYERIVEDDEDEQDERPVRKNGDDEDLIHHGFHPPAPVLILIAIGLLLIALAAFVVSRNQDPTPLCSQLPSWNQYDCIPG